MELYDQLPPEIMQRFREDCLSSANKDIGALIATATNAKEMTMDLMSMELVSLNKLAIFMLNHIKAGRSTTKEQVFDFFKHEIEAAYKTIESRADKYKPHSAGLVEEKITKKEEMN